MSLYEFSAVGEQISRSTRCRQDMLRRSILKALAAVPVVSSIPGRLQSDRDQLDRTFRNEQAPRFWFYFHAATRGGVGMSTHRSREAVIRDMNLTHLTADEAVETLRRAHSGQYSSEDIPSPLRGLFTDLDRAFGVDELIPGDQS